mmetsp:Transcript_18347/g.47848  ORF Transcript_18347/g.47848 Transcript_18347/m.47848 type:complete len:252 (-) Transcript_18347:1140-1895(-)
MATAVDTASRAPVPPKGPSTRRLSSATWRATEASSQPGATEAEGAASWYTTWPFLAVVASQRSLAALMATAGSCGRASRMRRMCRGADAVSHLFRASKIGNRAARKAATSLWRSASPHAHSVSMAPTPLFKSSLCTDKPTCSSTSYTRACGAWYPLNKSHSFEGRRRTEPHFVRTLLNTQRWISSRTHPMSANGSPPSSIDPPSAPLPPSGEQPTTALPSLSVQPLASTTCTSTDASQRSLRKALPRPLPW